MCACVLNLLHLDLLQACKVGDVYQAVDVLTSNIVGKWYLNVVVPATCSGSINSYKISFYDDDDALQEERTHDITVAIWKPINSTTFEKVNLGLFRA